MPANFGRRAFLQLLTAGTAGMVLDPERLLWVPGQKTIFIAPVNGWPFDAKAYVTRHWRTLQHAGSGIGPMGVGFWRLYIGLLAADGENSPVITRARHQIPTDDDARAVIREINRRVPQPTATPGGESIFTWFDESDQMKSAPPLSLADFVKWGSLQ